MTEPLDHEHTEDAGVPLDLPPEPGTVPEPDHGIPGPAEALPDGDAESSHESDDDPENYTDDEDGDEQ